MPAESLYFRSYNGPMIVRLGKVAILPSMAHPYTNVTASSYSGVTSTRRLIAAGCGWHVSDIEFRAETEACLLEGRHESFSIAAITEGSFRYRSTHGSAILTPGALLLGNAGDPFECNYEHTLGDRCISFYYTPEFFAAGCRDNSDGRAVRFRHSPHTTNLCDDCTDGSGRGGLWRCSPRGGSRSSNCRWCAHAHQ
jgi:AraC-like ligand binding domain